ncbi:hypothetical protein Vafri_8930 [Volvox africanus]|uniref:Uncharacterized protein n=1 Tax=Volvox africanus TaxID=51714 RepID=A0A8J4B3J4_9CHLO|nr:hypothetical protein Vafri_8930 [Volvox africanus]
MPMPIGIDVNGTAPIMGMGMPPAAPPITPELRTEPVVCMTPEAPAAPIILAAAAVAASPGWELRGDGAVLKRGLLPTWKGETPMPVPWSERPMGHAFVGARNESDMEDALFQS